MAADDDGTFQTLVSQRAEFIRFVRQRVESDAAAEEIVQTAFVRGVEHMSELDEAESVTAWFYRILRNAIVDHYRRKDAAGRALARVATELPAALTEAQLDDQRRVCACVQALASTLKPEYANILQGVDVEEHSLSEVAVRQGITTNNATVRLHRARRALRERVIDTCRTCAEHGCFDCTCKHA
jgi:RNA polymerase sigma-70 factor (ECF subfamily)